MILQKTKRIMAAITAVVITLLMLTTLTGCNISEMFGSKQPVPQRGYRAYAGAPPQIPHDLAGRDGYDEKGMPRCLLCHLTGEGGAFKMPYHHRKNNDPDGEMLPIRRNCKQCHTPQDQNTQLITENTFGKGHQQ